MAGVVLAAGAAECLRCPDVECAAPLYMRQTTIYVDEECVDCFGYDDADCVSVRKEALDGEPFKLVDGVYEHCE